MPPLDEKSSKLLKVNENLIRRKTEAAKVAAAEREKKKVHDPSLVIDLEKKTISKKRVSSTSEEEKHVVAEETRPEDEEPSGKRVRIEPSTRYPPKGKQLKATEELPVVSSADPEELEEREARGKRVAEMIQKQIAMASSAPTEHVAGLVDVIDETKELCYIDDDTPVETVKKESSALKIFDAKTESAMGQGESSGLKPHDSINLDSPEAEKPAAGQSRSPPPMLGDADKSAAETTGVDTTPLIKDTNVLQLEKAGVFS
jgi:hypothetical protein